MVHTIDVHGCDCRGEAHIGILKLCEHASFVARSIHKYPVLIAAILYTFISTQANVTTTELLRVPIVIGRDYPRTTGKAPTAASPAIGSRCAGTPSNPFSCRSHIAPVHCCHINYHGPKYARQAREWMIQSIVSTLEINSLISTLAHRI